MFSTLDREVISKVYVLLLTVILHEKKTNGNRISGFQWVSRLEYGTGYACIVSDYTILRSMFICVL